MWNEINSELLVRLRNGDEKAFEIVFYSFYGMLVNFADAYLADREASRDIVQSVFLKLWNKRDDILGDQSLKAWLYCLTRNECISYLRHLKVSRKFADKSREMTEKMQLHEEALQELDFNNMELDVIEKIIRDTLETLPERCREVFIMSRYDHLKNREIADQLGITLKAVEGNITRALKIFQVSLRDYLPSVFVTFLLHLQA